MAARYRPPASVPHSDRNFAAWLLQQLRQVGEHLESLSLTDPPTVQTQERIEVPAGAQRRVRPNAGGMVAVLDAPSSGNAGQSVTFFIENPAGAFVVVASPHVAADGKVTATLINDEARATYNYPGVVVLYSNGVDAWRTFAETPAEGPLVAAIAELSEEIGGLDFSVDLPPKRAYGNDLSVTAPGQAVTISQELDWIGGAEQFLFDGVDDNVLIGNALRYERTNSFSVSFWITPGNWSGSVVVLSNANGAADHRGWTIYCQRNSATLVTARFKLINTHNTNDLDVQADLNILDGLEHHVCFTYNGNSSITGVTAYIDNVVSTKTSILSSLSATIVGTGNLRIGVFGDTGTLFYPGVLRHISTWDKELSAVEVATVYNSATPGDLNATSFVGNLDAWWKLDTSDSASVVADHGPSGFNGIPQGGLGLSVAVGVIPVRGATEWGLLSPGAAGLPLLSTGLTSIPAYRRMNAPIALLNLPPPGLARASDAHLPRIPGRRIPGPQGAQGLAGPMGPPGRLRDGGGRRALIAPQNYAPPEYYYFAHTAGGTNDDFAPAGWPDAGRMRGAVVVVFVATLDATFTGFANGQRGARIIVVADTGITATVSHDTGSASANRTFTAGSAPLSIGPRQAGEFVYLDTDAALTAPRWHQIGAV